MTWNAFRTRGMILRDVADVADLRRDGALPWGLPGVAENFRDELDLVAALHLRWHTRLSGRIERRLAGHPDDLEAAIRGAWVDTAHDLPGIRAILDREAGQPTTPAVGEALAKARSNEHSLLALTAGQCGVADRRDPRAIAAGARIENAARAAYVPIEPTADAALALLDRPDADEPTSLERVAAGSATFVSRLKAVLAA